jgi:hypothetical protein
MQARCPRCASIFATDRSGLQFCPNCGQQVDVPSFPGAPPEGAGAGWGGPSGPGSFGPGTAIREDTPWERRATLGWFRGLFETWKRTVFTPQAFWASVKPDGQWTDAVLYAWILFAAGVLIALPFGGLGRFGMQSALDQMGDLPPGVRTALRSYASGARGYQFFSLIIYPLLLLIGAGIQHLFCMLFGVAKHGYYATLRVMGYAGVASIVAGIPCLGALAGLYAIVLVILGLSAVQEASVGRAAAAVLVPWLFLCCCGIAVAMAFGAALVAALGHSQ